MRTWTLRCTAVVTFTALTLLGAPALAQDAKPEDSVAPAKAPEAQTLDQLLRTVRSGWAKEATENKKREADFVRAKQDQAKLLKDAKAQLARLEKRAEGLERSFEENEIKITELEGLLKEKLGSLGELFGVVRQVAGDTSSHVENSMVSAQKPGREEFLTALGKSKSLPSIEKLRGLWYALLEEMTESGKVVRFPATVVTTAGNEEQREVIRAGVFNAVSDGKYLTWDTETRKLQEIGRQPAARYLETVPEFENTTSGMGRLAVDPSRGAILALLVDTPSTRERIDQGGVVGYAIIVLGLFAGALGFARLAYVFLVSRKVSSQQKSSTPDDGNPLGRILGLFDANKDADAETLELKLDEAILRESTSLDRFLWIVKVISVVAPLMGLLGTVTGMITTFQAITLFGTGDPKLMAGGISEALVTTMLGLIVAIPLVLLHSIMTSVSHGVVDILEEQSAGMVARRAEEVA